MRCPNCADTSVQSAVYSGATALVPPVERRRRNATTFHPVSGSALPEPSGSPRPSAPPSAERGRIPSAAWYEGTGNTVLTPLPAAPAPARELVPHRLGPNPAASRQQRRPAARPCMWARRGKLRMLIAVHLGIGRPGIACRGAEGHAVERAGRECGVEPAHPLWRPVILRRPPADRHGGRLADRIARRCRRCVDEPALAVRRVVADDGEVRFRRHGRHDAPDHLVVEGDLDVRAVRVWSWGCAVQPHVGDIRRVQAEARKRGRKVEGVDDTTELDHCRHQLEARTAVGADAGSRTARRSAAGRTRTPRTGRRRARARANVPEGGRRARRRLQRRDRGGRGGEPVRGDRDTRPCGRRGAPSRNAPARLRTRVTSCSVRPRSITRRVAASSPVTCSPAAVAHRTTRSRSAVSKPWRAVSWAMSRWRELGSGSDCSHARLSAVVGPLVRSRSMSVTPASACNSSALSFRRCRWPGRVPPAG